MRFVRSLLFSVCVVAEHDQKTTMMQQPHYHQVSFLPPPRKAGPGSGRRFPEAAGEEQMDSGSCPRAEGPAATQQVAAA